MLQAAFIYINIRQNYLRLRLNNANPKQNPPSKAAANAGSGTTVNCKRVPSALNPNAYSLSKPIIPKSIDRSSSGVPFRENPPSAFMRSYVPSLTSKSVKSKFIFPPCVEQLPVTVISSLPSASSAT